MAVKLTTKGEELLQKLQAGEIEKLIFTDMAIGCGSWNNDELVANISALKDIKLKQAVATKYAENKGNQTFIFVSTTFSNKTVTDAFYVYEVGLYALNGDTEVLYAYDIITTDMPAQAVVQDQSVPQYVPVSIDIGISNIDAINLTLTDDLSVVSAEQFRSHIEDYNNPHKVINITGNASTANMAESLGYKVLLVGKPEDLGYDANLVTSPGQYLIIFNTDVGYNIMRDGHYAYDYGILYLNVELISIKDPDTEEEIEIIMQECLAPFSYWLKSNNSMNRTSGLQSNPSDFTDWIEKSISVTAFNPLPINHGGTGETTADNARNALKAAAISHTHKEYQPAGDYANINHKHDLTDNKIEGILPLNKGGTGADTADNARNNLGAAAINHAHTGYQPLGNYASQFHNHAGVYQPAGDYPLKPSYYNWRSAIYSKQNNRIEIPGGGTWAYVVFSEHFDTVRNTTAGIASGGSVLYVSTSPQFINIYGAFCWRIA